jgi:hypothetical protein
VNVEPQTVSGVTATALLLAYFIKDQARCEVVLATGAAAGERIKFPELPMLASVDNGAKLPSAHYRAVRSALKELTLDGSSTVNYHGKTAHSSAGTLKVASFRDTDAAEIVDTHHQDSVEETQKRGAKKHQQQHK